MRPPFALRATAATTALALTLAACSGSADDGEDATSSSPSSTSPSASSSESPSSTSATVAGAKITGAPAALTAAVQRKYGSAPVAGKATTGTWRGSKVAVVTADDDSDD